MNKRAYPGGNSTCTGYNSECNHHIRDPRYDSLNMEGTQIELEAWRWMNGRISDLHFSQGGLWMKSGFTCYSSAFVILHVTAPRKHNGFSWKNALGMYVRFCYICSHHAGGIFNIIAWHFAGNGLPLWEAIILAVSIRYSGICWQAYPLTSNTFKLSPTGTLLVLIPIITEMWNWEMTFQRIGYCQFTAWAPQDVNTLTYRKVWLNRSQLEAGVMSRGAEEGVFYRHCAFRSADMQTRVCISFLLVSYSCKHCRGRRGESRSELKARASPQSIQM